MRTIKSAGFCHCLLTVGLLFFVFLLLPPAVQADDSMAAETVFDGVSSLERALGIAANNQLPVSQRLSVVEQRVFGQSQNGSLLGRVQHIKDTLETGLRAPAGMPGDCLPLLNTLAPNFTRVETAETLAANGADYFGQIMSSSQNKIIRFKQMPVPVFVNQFPDKQFTAAVVRGFETWEDMTGGAVRFVQVEDPNKARIQVAWKRLGGQEDKSGCALGAHTITKWIPKGKGNVAVIGVGGVPVPIYIPKLGPKFNVPPQVIEINLDLITIKTPAIRYRLLQNVVTHELGHALGLFGHSTVVTDMMYSVTDEHSRLSQRDINTLIRIYKQKVDIPL